MHVSNLNTTYFALAKGDDALSYENVIMQFNSAKAQSPLAISGLLRERERGRITEKNEKDFDGCNMKTCPFLKEEGVV